MYCFMCRFDAHIMFSLARGKVSESSARLALAKEMMKVSNRVKKNIIIIIMCSS